MRAAAALCLALAAAHALAADPPGRAKAQACAPCHGPVGVAVAPDAPNLAGQPRMYLVSQLKAFRAGKRQHEVMSVIAKPLTDDDIDQLAGWFSSIEIEAKVKP